MKKIIFSFCALIAFMNAKAQVIEVWDATPAKVLSCQGLTFSAEIYTTQDGGTNTIDIKKYINNNSTNIKQFGSNHNVRVYKGNTSPCLYGNVPTSDQAVDMGQTREIDGVTYRVLWAPWDLGANNANDAGCFFSWGDLVQDGYAYDKTGKYGIMADNTAGYLYDEAHATKKPSSKAVLSKEEDIAYQWWGNNGGTELADGTIVGAWRMPTGDELAWLAVSRSIANWVSNTAWNGTSFISLPLLGNAYVYRVDSQINSKSLTFYRVG